MSYVNDFVPTENYIKRRFKNWLGNNIPNEIIKCFLFEDVITESNENRKQKNRVSYNKVNFDCFDFNAKFTLVDIKRLLAYYDFEDAVISSIKRLPENANKIMRKVIRDHIKEILNKSISESRNSTKKFWGWAVYQEKEPRTVFNKLTQMPVKKRDGSYIIAKHFLIVPIRTLFFEKLKEQFKANGISEKEALKEIKELISRSEQFRTIAFRRKRKVDEEIRDVDEAIKLAEKIEQSLWIEVRRKKKTKPIGVN